MSSRDIDQRRIERILTEINQVYDDAYELGYQSGKQQKESEIERTNHMMEQSLNRLKRLINEANEKVEVVRCKNCKFQGKPLTDEFTPCKHEKGLLFALDENFCSYAERKKSGEQ